MTTHSLARFDAAPYGVYRWVGEVPPGDTQPDNGRATMGRGQWPPGWAGTGTDKAGEPNPAGRFPFSGNWN